MRIIVSAGGSGGHIYPALAIIEKIKREEPNSEFLYIGTHNRMEKDIVPKHKIKFIPLKIYGFSSRNMIRNFKNIFFINKSYKKCKKIIKEFKPNIVIGVGGYVTYPVLKAAHKLKVKTFIHEQNAIPGKSNRALSKFVDVVAVSFPETKKYFNHSRVYVTGNPCGERAILLPKASKITLGLSKTKKLVTIVAGSQGSYSLNNFFKKYLSKQKNKDFEIVYITGKDYFESFNDNIKFPENIKVIPYYEDLTRLLKVSDLIISRSGATTISEIIALNIPNILIPSPYVPNNHQYYNAKRLSDKNASILIEEKDLEERALNVAINKLLSDEKEIKEMKKGLLSLKVNNSSEYIYSIVKDMII